MKQKLIFLLIMAFIPMAMMASVEVNGIYYNLNHDDKTAVVTFNDYAGNIVIPSSIKYYGNPYSVTSIGSNAFDACNGLTSIDIPSSVTSIGYCAFRNCRSLTSIDIPENVTIIGWDAFYGCSGLTSIDIPSSVTSIGIGVFSNCSGLTSITVASGNTNYDSRNNCNAIIEKSSNTLIAGCKNTIIPNSVTSIGPNAFYACSGLTSIDIPSSVTSIGNCAFESCGLTSIDIPSSVTSIGSSAFRWCSGLISIDIPSSVTSIGNGAFNLCSGLTSITVASGNTNYDSRNNCNAIIEKSSNTLIAGCKNTIIPNSVTSIGYEAFLGCSGLTSITIPNSVTVIGDKAFYSCSGLTSITIPNSVTRIGDKAFQYCISLTSVTVENPTPVSISEDTFYNRARATLYVPRGSISAYQNAPYWQDFKDIIEISDAPITVVISITAAGMGTYCSPYDLDFSTVTGLKAYIITGYDWQSKRVYATRVYDVPAGTGIYLVGAAADYTVPISSSTSYYINMLVGTLSDTEIEPTDGEYTNLRLTGTSPSNASFKFLEASRIIPANKAYLQIPTNVLGNSANAVGIIFDDETDGIESIEQNIDDNNDWFTLDGRKINGMPTTKGVYVVKGRKVVIK